MSFFDLENGVKFEAMTTPRARISKSLIHCLYMKTIGAKQAKVHFAYFVQRDQLGLIANTSPTANFYFKVTFPL